MGVESRLAVIAAWMVLGTASASEPPRGPSLRSLVSRIPHVAEDGDGIGEAERELAERIQVHGAAAIPRLLPLLGDKTEAVREFAGYALRDLDGFTEEHLDALIRARRRGNGWIPPAIARIGTARAISFLVEDLQATPESQTQVTWALSSAGGKAAVALAETFRAPAPVGEDFVRAVCEVLDELGAASGSAVSPLLAVATGRSPSPANQAQALQALGCIGLPAESAVPALLALRSKEPALRDEVDDALVGIGGSAAVPILIERLRARPSVVVLRDIAELRERGHDTGGAVAELLSREDWRLRAAAARTLGYIQYAPATDALIALLEDVADWQRVYVAAESLGRLRAARALPALERVAKTHWFPPVRDAALLATKVIQGKAGYRVEPRFPFEYFAYERVEFEKPASLQPPLANEAEVLSLTELGRLAYEVQVKGERGMESVKQRPGCGLRVPEGYLLGSDRGERGGELVLVQGGAPPTKLLDANTRAVHRLGQRIIAVTGLPHVTSKRGMLYQVRPRGSSWVAEPWRALPGGPMYSGLLADGRLFVSCLDGEVIVTPEGHMELATPENLAPPPR